MTKNAHTSMKAFLFSTANFYLHTFSFYFSPVLKEKVPTLLVRTSPCTGISALPLISLGALLQLCPLPAAALLKLARSLSLSLSHPLLQPLTHCSPHTLTKLTQTGLPFQAPEFAPLLKGSFTPAARIFHPPFIPCGPASASASASLRSGTTPPITKPGGLSSVFRLPDLPAEVSLALTLKLLACPVSRRSSVSLRMLVLFFPPSASSCQGSPVTLH